MAALDRLSAHGIELEVLRAGAGHPVLLLHGMAPLDLAAPVVDLLAAHAKILAPSHPGFGGSPRPAAFDTIYDLVHLYRDVLDHLPDEAVTLLGLSFGGWLAAEIATLGHPRVDALVLWGAALIGLTAEQAIAKGLMFAGNPDTVYRQILEHRERVGPYEHLVLASRSGFMTHQEATAGLARFSKDVLPSLKEL